MVNSSCITICSLLVNWEQHGFQAFCWIWAIELTYLMCLGIIISTGIYLSVAICSYIKYRSIFIQCCGGISIYGASLGCLCILAVILGLIGPIILPLCILSLFIFYYGLNGLSNKSILVKYIGLRS